MVNRRRLEEKALHYQNILVDMLNRGHFRGSRDYYEMIIREATDRDLRRYIRKSQETLSRRGQRRRFSSVPLRVGGRDDMIVERTNINATPIRATGAYYDQLLRHYRFSLQRGNDILSSRNWTNGIVRVKINYQLIVNGVENQYKSHNIRSERQLKELLRTISEIPSAQRGYATSFTILIFQPERDLLIDADEGGALVSSHRDLKRNVFICNNDNLHIFNLTSVRSSNNNCLIDTLKRKSKYKKTAKTIRNILNIEHKIKLPSAIIRYLCEGYFKDITSVRVQRLDDDKIKDVYIYGEPYPCEYQVELVLMNEHFYLKDDLILYKTDEVKFSKKRKDWICNKCNNPMRANHRCSKSHINYMRQQRMKYGINEEKAKDSRENYLPIDTLTRDIPFSVKRMIFFDIETFIDEENDGIEHIPYAIGFIDMADGKYQLYEGKDCMVNFVKYLLTKQNKYICAYNGSGFDFRFLISELVKQGEIPRNPVIANNYILSAKFGNFKTPNVLWDVCRFTLSSLKNAGKSFKLQVEKGDFNHNLIKCWNDVEKYKLPRAPAGRQQPDGTEGWKPYLKKDVLVLKDLFVAFNNKIFETFQIYPVEYVSLSSMTYALWKRGLKVNYEEGVDEFSDIKKNYTEKQYNFIRSSVYGGRTYLYRMFFQSKNYKVITEINEKFKGEEKTKKLKEMYKKIYDKNDFIYNGDVNSLYPACMVEHFYPVGDCRWSDKPEEEFNKGKMGIYEVELFCNNKIKVPVVPIKIDKGLRWITGNIKGVYNSVDIKNCLRFGYEVKFFNQCLVWDEKRKDVFTEFINNCYELKKQAGIDGDDVLYAISKLLMNALYGKMLQRAFKGKIEFCKNIKEMVKFEKECTLDNWIVLNNDTLILIGEKKDFEPCIRKPNYLGSFILGYSRRIMLDLFSELSPDLSKCPFTYTDTDSLHIKGKFYKKLLERGLIDDNKLGYCSNDIKEEGLIIKEINIAPKVYLYEYITNKGEIKTTMKCKGIPKNFLQKEFYSSKEMKPLKLYKEDEKGRLKKISFKSFSKSDVNEGLTPLSIVVRPMTRTFNKSKWEGAEIDEEKNKINFFHQLDR
tara:strand:+ start:286 stop:3519 length:3234 start_codon:yes stop_codon:yes gene_type:complete